ncbi:MAG TPA: hypothetical protein VJ946_14740 [Bacteroidales bacterium]|nr:hypothetical protein [Bacteroidales bacterium]
MKTNQIKHAGFFSAKTGQPPPQYFFVLLNRHVSTPVVSLSDCRRTQSTAVGKEPKARENHHAFFPAPEKRSFRDKNGVFIIMVFPHERKPARHVKAIAVGRRAWQRKSPLHPAFLWNLPSFIFPDSESYHALS